MYPSSVYLGPIILARYPTKARQDISTGCQNSSCTMFGLYFGDLHGKQVICRTCGSIMHERLDKPIIVSAVNPVSVDGLELYNDDREAYEHVYCTNDYSEFVSARIGDGGDYEYLEMAEFPRLTGIPEAIEYARQQYDDILIQSGYEQIRYTFGILSLEKPESEDD